MWDKSTNRYRRFPVQLDTGSVFLKRVNCDMYKEDCILHMQYSRNNFSSGFPYLHGTCSEDGDFAFFSLAILGNQKAAPDWTIFGSRVNEIQFHPLHARDEFDP